MTSLNDRLFDIERRLAEFPEHDAASLLNRRMILRKELRAFGDDRYQEGYGDGRRDTVETRLLAEELAGKEETGT